MDASNLLLLLRHAVSEKNLRDHHGHNVGIDYGLTPDGLASANALATTLRQFLSIRTVHTCGSLAPTQTAGAIANAYSLPVNPVISFHSVHMGILAGLTKVEMLAQHPQHYEEMQRFERGEIHAKNLTTPGREPFDLFQRRVVDVLNGVTRHAFPAVLVGHTSTIRMALNIITSHGDPGAASYTMFPCPPLSLALVEAGRSLHTWRLIEVGLSGNDLARLLRYPGVS